MVCCGMVRNEVKQVIDFAQDLNAETFDYSRIGFSRFFKTGWFCPLTPLLCGVKRLKYVETYIRMSFQMDNLNSQ